MAKKTMNRKNARSDSDFPGFGLSGIAEDVITAALQKIGLSRQTQKEFLQEIRKQAVTCLSGRVSRISTSNDDVTTVVISSTNGAPAPEGSVPNLESFFYAPQNLPESLLNELKRAQGARLCVRICYYENTRKVISVDVFDCPGK